ncbi:MAG: hypothetical protein IPM97_08165 [Bdellovibrionaceae bacterium]|nr:hypothetical protein [Pseudobdellovibrionaceae bacterium]
MFVIIDNGCGSSCESTLDALRVHPRVKVVGQNSKGKHAYGNVFPLTLPKSGLDVILASHHWQFVDNKNIENWGIPPTSM